MTAFQNEFMIYINHIIIAISCLPTSFESIIPSRNRWLSTNIKVIDKFSWSVEEF